MKIRLDKSSFAARKIDKNCGKGFTLLELLIIMGILTTVAVISGINLSNYYSRQNLTSAANEIVAILRQAQNNSLSQESGDQWGVHFLNATTTQGLVQLFRGSSFTSGILVNSQALPAGVQFVYPALGSSTDVIFSKVTGYPNASTSIFVALKNNPAVSYAITINEVGRVARASSLVADALAYWKLNDSTAATLILDSVGGYNMTLLGGKNTSDISTVGKINNAFTFVDGVSVGSLPDQANLRLDEFSVAFWFYRRMANTSTYNIQAETYVTGVGQTTSYLSRSCVLGAAASGAGYVMSRSFASSDYGPIKIWPTLAIATKPGASVKLLRIELWQNSSLVASGDVWTGSFSAAGLWIDGYNISGSSIFRFITPATAAQYTYKIWSYGNQDFYADRVSYDIYHNSPVGKSNDWAFWANGASFEVQTSAGRKAAATSSSNIPKDAWTLIVGTFSRSDRRVRIWTNTTLRATTATGGDLSPSWTTAPIYIGGKSSSENSLVYGDVDNVMFFNKELNQEEITTLYNNSFGTEVF